MLNEQEQEDVDQEQGEKEMDQEQEEKEDEKQTNLLAQTVAASLARTSCFNQVYNCKSKVSWLLGYQEHPDQSGPDVGGEAGAGSGLKLLPHQGLTPHVW